MKEKDYFFFFYIFFFSKRRGFNVEQNVHILGFKYDLQCQIQVNGAFKPLLLLRTIQPKDDAIHNYKWKFWGGTEFIHQLKISRYRVSFICIYLSNPALILLFVSWKCYYAQKDMYKQQ